MRRPKGFTIVELVTILTIIAVVGAIAVPRLSNYFEDSDQAAFISDLRSIARAAECYKLETDFWPEDSSSGVFPRWMDDYYRREKWEAGTPVGGVWDAEYESFGCTSSVGVHFYRLKPYRDDAYMLGIDRRMDDGVLAGGAFRKIASDRYYWILDP